MNEIRPWLLTGNWHEAQDLSFLQENNIEALLLLFRPVEHSNIETRFVATDDGYPFTEEMIVHGLDFIKEQHALGRRILVTCGAGVSRSPLFAIAALHEIEGLSMIDGYWQIKASNERAMPDQQQWDNVCDYFDEPTPFWDLFRGSEL